jgi:hypothetical protein
MMYQHIYKWSTVYYTSLDMMPLHTLIENQQMDQNDHFIAMFSQMLLHVSAYQCHHQRAHMIRTSYLYVGLHYKKNDGALS